ncbi:MAG: FAD-dependent oxidoreductase [Armatimonadota bacterium]
MTEFRDVIVLGAGLTGLAAARKLSAQSVDSLVLEKESFPGGRLSSEEFEGCILDRGFQVILPAYPSIRSLNLPLRLRPFSQASTCISSQGKSVLPDPIHNFKLFCSNLGSSPASISDLFRLLKHLQSRRFDISTDGLLDELGYSNRLKNDFLRPFLQGVLLDPALKSPSPLSSYFLARFFLGGAALVEGGIQEFPRAMANDLKILFDSEVVTQEGNQVTTKDGKTFAAKIIIDTRPDIAGKGVEWLSTHCHYFLSSAPVPLEKRIVLYSSSMQTSINQVANLSEVAPGYSPAGTALLSVTSRDFSSSDVDQLKSDLVSSLDLASSQVSHLKSIQVERAIPFASHLWPEFPEPPTPKKIESTVYASDTLSYGSQHAALRMGDRAADLAILTLKT